MNNLNDGMIGPLPAAINKVNPVPDADAVSVTGLIKQSGRVNGYQLSNGQQVTKDQGVDMAKNHKIRGVGVAQNKGSEYLRALPDGNQSTNLSSLPTVG